MSDNIYRVFRGNERKGESGKQTQPPRCVMYVTGLGLN